MEDIQYSSRASHGQSDLRGGKGKERELAGESVFLFVQAFLVEAH